MPAMSRLYWYGWKGNIETVSTANGWTCGLSGHSFIDPTWNTNNIYLSAPPNRDCEVGNKESINFTSAYMIARCTNDTIGLNMLPDKTTGWHGTDTSSATDTKVSIQNDGTKHYIYAACINANRSGYVSAIVYEP